MFDSRGCYRLQRSLLESVGHAGVVGLVVGSVKDELDSAFKVCVCVCARTCKYVYSISLFDMHSTFEHGVMRVLFTVHLNGASNLESKTLTTPKLKELQNPKVSLKQPLLAATIPPSLM